MRPTDRFPWQRWWVAEGEELRLDADGFYAEAGDEFWPLPRVGRTLEELRDVPCLVLLGEAGMGKTTVVEDHVAASDGKACVVDLKNFSVNTLDLLCNKIEGAVSRGVRQLFFDSLDEAQLRSEEILYRLVDILDPAFAVRIICRFAEWPDDGSSALEERFGNEAVQIWRLAPLSREDVVTAATVREIDPEKFFRALFVAGVAPLAAVPITLGMLLHDFAKDGDLPNRATEIYERAIDRLIREGNKVRDSRHAKAMLDPKYRLAVAKRLAACSVFCNRPIILGTVPNQPVEGVLVASEITDGPEEAHGGVRITEKDVREVLSTALFRSVGGGRFAFIHRTFAEYLAAEWAWAAHLSPKQRAQLLCSTFGEPAGIPPGLHGIAAWLAARDGALLDLIAASDPDILLGSAHLLSHADRSQLVGALLEAYERLEAFPQWGAVPAYSRLNHPRLADQLRPWVTGERGNRLARRGAIDIAGACGVEGLGSELLALVEDEHEEYELRIQALAALIRLPDVVCTGKLRDLALGKVDDVPDGRLRGLALLYLWPRHLGTAEVFRSLTPPRRTDPWSCYQRFAKHELMERLADDELAIAMSAFADLVGRQPRFRRYDSWFADIAKGLWARALRLGVSPDLVKATARLLIAGERTNLLPFDELLREEELTDTFRRALAREIVAFRSGEEDVMGTLFFHLIHAGDLSWLLEELRDADPDEEKKVWAELASRAWLRMRRSMEGFAQLYPVADEEPALRERLRSWMDGIALDSEEARRQRESWERERESKKYYEELSAENWTCEKIREVADRLLNRAASGEPRGWCNLVRLLEEVRPASLNGLEEDPPAFERWCLETYPAFPCLDDPLRVRLAEAADRYLHEGAPGIDEPEGWWFRTDPFERRPVAAIAALGWLREHALSAFTRLPAEVWVRWAPAIVEHGDHRAEPGRALADVCYRLAPEALLSALHERLELGLSRGETEHALLRLAQRLGDDRVLDFLADQLRMERLNPWAAFEIAQMLAETRPDACEEAIRRGGEGHDGG